MRDNAQTRPPLKLSEVCERLRVSRGVAARLIARGDLHGVKIGREWRFDASAVDALLAPPTRAA